MANTIEGGIRIARIRERFADRVDLAGVTFVTDDAGRELEFDTLAGAIEKRDELDAATYVTKDGEAGRPDYLIVDSYSYDWLKCDIDERFDAYAEDNGYDEDPDDDDAKTLFVMECDERYARRHSFQRFVFEALCYGNGDGQTFRDGWDPDHFVPYAYRVRPEDTFDTLEEAQAALKRLEDEGTMEEARDNLFHYGIRKFAIFDEMDDTCRYLVEIC